VSTSRRLLPGVFVASHAIAEGVLTRGQLRTRSYRRLVQGVYADPGLEFDHRLRCQAVALLLPTGAAIGGHSAAAWYGAPFAGTTDPVTVICPDQLRWGGPRGVRVHRSALGPAEIRQSDDVPVTSVRRTAWDVAALEPLPVAVAALDAMVRAGRLRMAELRELAAQGHGRWRVTRVRRAVALVDPRAESAPESRVRVALVLAGLAPQPQYEIYDGGRFLARADFAWPEARLVLEYEGAYHFEGGQIVRDDARIERLVAAGWRVLRISAADLRDLDRVVATVRQALLAA
jgi:very-short-patch-repair endonuclease